jgi:hypothetical protein
MTLVTSLQINMGVRRGPDTSVPGDPAVATISIYTDATLDDQDPSYYEESIKLPCRTSELAAVLRRLTDRIERDASPPTKPQRVGPGPCMIIHPDGHQTKGYMQEDGTLIDGAAW